MEDYDQLKFIAGEVALEQDYCFLRVQDPMLLEIEALVEQNKVSEAQAKLTEFAKKRDPKFEAKATQEELREQVRFQRRIELWGEGTNWFDMKRWNLTINRNRPNTNHKKVFTVEPNSLGFLHRLPQAEMDANKQLVQN